MTGVKHAFSSGKADDADATLVNPSDWNAEHEPNLTTKGDLIVRGASAGLRLGVGSDGKALIAKASESAGMNWQAVVLASLLTTQGDIFVRGASDLERLAIGTALQQLRVNSGATAIEYFTLAHGDLSDAPATAHHNNANDPTSGQKAALPGTGGTPGSGNKYVTDEDSRLSQKTRRVPMQMLMAPTQGASGQLFYPDNVVTAFHAAIPIPSDWVAGTDLTLVVFLRKAGAGIEAAVMTSWISSIAVGETWTWNIEDNVVANQTLQPSNEVLRATRTITAADVSADENIEWLLRRQGDAGTDTLEEPLFIDGVWLEYEAAF